MVAAVKNRLQSFVDPVKGTFLNSYFKTGKGQYAEGDIFLGITVPKQRTVALEFIDLPLNELKELLSEDIHEYRLTALLILVYKYKKVDKEVQEKIYNFYLKAIPNINNWDLVDTSAASIIGNYLLHNEDRSILYTLVKSSNIWERRISIVATHEFIRNNQFEDTLNITELLLEDKHDLIHKAVGWMLREIGKRNREVEERFLNKYFKVMPRTMLRYSIEHFDDQKKKFYMNKSV